MNQTIRRCTEAMDDYDWWCRAGLALLLAPHDALSAPRDGPLAPATPAASQSGFRLLDLTEEGLEKIAAYKRKTTVEILGARVGKVLLKYKMSKFVQWHIDPDPDDGSSRKHRVLWSLDEEKIAEEKLLDGCYVIRTDVSGARMKKDEVVASYKALGNVERAFRSLKTVHLEMRPVYHKKDDRIKAHVFLCTLAYNVQWHMVERLRALFDSDGEGKERRWTVENVIERLKQICRNRVEVGGAEFFQITELDDEQKQITELLGVTM